MADTAAAAPVQPPKRSLFKRILLWFGVLVLIVAGAGAYLWAFETTGHSKPAVPPKAIVKSGDPIIDSIRRGAEFLKTYQEADGHFSKGAVDFKPALTAIVVDAMARSPEKYREKDHPWLEKAVKGIVECQQPDGAIYTPLLGMQTYCTSISLLALTAVENPAYAKNIERARDYLISVQYKDDEKDPMFGGAGYSVGGKATGDVTAQWVEALKEAGVKEDSDAFKNAQKFFQRLQNDPESNKEPAPGFDVGNDGGFFYRPGESKAGNEVVNGKKIPKSYGLMSYAGIHSFMYMNVPKTDNRVKSAFRWVKDNYTLEENRNIGADGLYRYYLTMAKALYIYGEPVIETADGKSHHWAEELSEKVISLQREDGAWRNTRSGKWLEDDVVLVTGYAIRTLTICHEALEREKAKK